MLSEDIKFILQRYPRFKDDIVKAYADSEEFRTLCEDMFTMSRTLEQQPEKVFSDLNNELEYRKLLLELENEFLKYLSDARIQGSKEAV